MCRQDPCTAVQAFSPNQQHRMLRQLASHNLMLSPTNSSMITSTYSLSHPTVKDSWRECQKYCNFKPSSNALATCTPHATYICVICVPLQMICVPLHQRHEHAHGSSREQPPPLVASKKSCHLCASSRNSAQVMGNLRDTLIWFQVCRIAGTCCGWRHCGWHLCSRGFCDYVAWCMCWCIGRCKAW